MRSLSIFGLVWLRFDVLTIYYVETSGEMYVFSFEKIGSVGGGGQVHLSSINRETILRSTRQAITEKLLLKPIHKFWFEDVDILACSPRRHCY